MRHAANMLGLLAYLTVMNGGLPDRRVLAAAYRGAFASDPVPSTRLHVIPPTGEGAGPEVSARAAEDDKETRAA